MQIGRNWRVDARNLRQGHALRQRWFSLRPYFGAHVGQAFPDVSLAPLLLACGIAFVFGGLGVAAADFDGLGMTALVSDLEATALGLAVAFATNSLALVASAMAWV
jgi:hypothetical protein